jgi:hypothetical protein
MHYLGPQFKFNIWGHQQISHFFTIKFFSYLLNLLNYIFYIVVNSHIRCAKYKSQIELYYSFLQFLWINLPFYFYIIKRFYLSKLKDTFFPSKFIIIFLKKRKLSKNFLLRTILIMQKAQRLG